LCLVVCSFFHLLCLLSPSHEKKSCFDISSFQLLFVGVRLCKWRKIFKNLLRKLYSLNLKPLLLKP
jgi:hypothetical protein